MQQVLVFYNGRTVIVQDEQDTYTATAEEFLAEGGVKPPYQTIDYNRSIGSCLIDGEPAGKPSDGWADAMLAKLPELLSAQQARFNRITDDRFTADQQKWAKEAEDEEAARLAAMTVEDVRAEKLAAINTACDAILTDAIASYPGTEVQTFDQQVAEVEKYQQSGNPADAPLLSALADARGIALDDLCTRVLKKRAAFSALSGYIIGQRQALEDQLDKLTTIEEIRALTVNIALPD